MAPVSSNLEGADYVCLRMMSCTKMDMAHAYFFIDDNSVQAITPSLERGTRDGHLESIEFHQ